MNHLWQSSGFVILAAALAFVLRRSPASVRYWIWLSASLKFLAPLTLLLSLGSMIPRPVPSLPSITVPLAPALLKVAEPFTPTPDSIAPAQAPADWMPIAIRIAWAVGFLVVMLMRCRGWLHIRAILRAATPVELPVPIPAVIAPGAAEPGIVGFLRPVLILPPGLMDHLNASQLDAVLAHEMCHVRRRDNLFAAVHMAVEAIFWFHPLVWWIGSRMIEERERACDEEVLQQGCEPADYVEGILKVCRLYKEAPLPCVSGVTGADVKKRLRAILAGTIAREWNAGKKATLAAVGLATLAAPIVIGVLNAPAIRAQSAADASPRFEVASVKPSPPVDRSNYTVSFTGGPETKDPGLFRCVNFPLSGLVARAYSSTSFQVKAPQWMNDQMFDISAKVPEGATKEQFDVMLQNLLIDRFRLTVHHEAKEQAMYELVVTATGPKLKNGLEDTDGRLKPPLPKGRNGRYRPHETMSSFAAYLTIYMHEFVKDATGLKGEYETNLSWVQNADVNSNGPTLAQALQEQLGLKLKATKGPVDFLVVDHAEKLPTDN